MPRDIESYLITPFDQASTYAPRAKEVSIHLPTPAASLWRQEKKIKDYQAKYRKLGYSEAQINRAIARNIAQAPYKPYIEQQTRNQATNAGACAAFSVAWLDLMWEAVGCPANGCDNSGWFSSLAVVQGAQQRMRQLMGKSRLAGGQNLPWQQAALAARHQRLQREAYLPREQHMNTVTAGAGGVSPLLHKALYSKPFDGAYQARSERGARIKELALRTQETSQQARQIEKQYTFLAELHNKEDLLLNNHNYNAMAAAHNLKLLWPNYMETPSSQAMVRRVADSELGGISCNIYIQEVNPSGETKYSGHAIAFFGIKNATARNNSVNTAAPARRVIGVGISGRVLYSQPVATVQQPTISMCKGVNTDDCIIAFDPNFGEYLISVAEFGNWLHQFINQPPYQTVYQYSVVPIQRSGQAIFGHPQWPKRRETRV